MPPLKTEFGFLNSTIKRNLRIKDGFVFGFWLCPPTACVTCVWAGVDNAWEQEKPEARKMLVNRADSHTSGAPMKMRDIIFYERNRRALGQYTPKRQARKLPFGQSSGERYVRLPRCTVVSGQIDLPTGGVAGRVRSVSRPGRPR